ncbi:hypothetical protein [Methanoculleus sp. 10]|uniref:hypothetical protein n=1 Tax=Methanoculleus sp. 10 TaxID=430615 RepID=UPI0025FA088E|nr:hypothetical protein [Methanoculleus sp. 10]
MVKQALFRIRRTIVHSKNLHQFNEETMFVEPVELMIEGCPSPHMATIAPSVSRINGRGDADHGDRGEAEDGSGCL